MDAHQDERNRVSETDSDDPDFSPLDEGSVSEDEYFEEDRDKAKEDTEIRGGRKRKSMRLNSEQNSNKLRVLEAVDNLMESPAERKNKIDALWVEFNEESSQPEAALNKEVSPIHRTSTQKMLTITEKYEFAGETIIETKDVLEDSDAATKFLATRENSKSDNIQLFSPLKDENPSINSIANSNSPSDTSNTLAHSSSSRSKSLSAKSNRSASVIAERSKAPRLKSNLSRLASSLNKKPTKINTLDKSKMDWNKYVEKEGIVDELKYHNKSGFVDKQEFLQRTYERQEAEYKSFRKGTKK